jgi:hypothetical protein
MDYAKLRKKGGARLSQETKEIPDLSRRRSSCHKLWISEK